MGTSTGCEGYGFGAGESRIEGDVAADGTTNWKTSRQFEG
jgi:hypothetical protein